MKERIYFLDNMRAVLILLIIATHTLQIFNPNRDWLITVNDTFKYSPSLIDFFMLFTLESFFIISGYLTVMSINRLGVERFFESRIKRVVLPIIVTALTLNSLQSYILVNYHHNIFNLEDYLINGKWISHLWFLIDLSIFSFISYLLYRFFHKNILLIKSFCTYFLRDNIYLNIIFFSIIIVLFSALFSIFSSYINNQIINVNSLIFYFPFFILGICLFVKRGLLEDTFNIYMTPLFILVLSSIYFSYLFSDGSGILEKIGYYFFNALSSFSASILFFKIFYKFFNKKNNILSKIAYASYSIYLVHHLLIILGAIVIIKLDLSIYFALISLFLIVSFLSFMIHYYVISKTSLLRFLFNGISMNKKDR